MCSSDLQEKSQALQSLSLQKRQTRFSRLASVAPTRGPEAESSLCSLTPEEVLREFCELIRQEASRIGEWAQQVEQWEINLRAEFVCFLSEAMKELVGQTQIWSDSDYDLAELRHPYGGEAAP